VGERGQVVIPADARKQMGINPGDKLLVMGHPVSSGVVLCKIDAFREFLSGFLEGLSGVESRLNESQVDEAETD
jgi:bifunctional DNA-binding transcriptional regulator/antitoxin component of YhaV-PrlF toxin-antitoxin module